MFEDVRERIGHGLLEAAVALPWAALSALRRAWCFSVSLDMTDLAAGRGARASSKASPTFEVPAGGLAVPCQLRQAIRASTSSCRTRRWISAMAACPSTTTSRVKPSQ
jgi:hypothetical protein